MMVQEGHLDPKDNPGAMENLVTSVSKVPKVLKDSLDERESAEGKVSVTSGLSKK